MQMSTTRRDCFINGNDTLSEFGANSAIHPGSQASALLNVAPVDAEYPALKLQDRYRGDVEITGILRA